MLVAYKCVDDTIIVIMHKAAISLVLKTDIFPVENSSPFNANPRENVCIHHFLLRTYTHSYKLRIPNSYGIGISGTDTVWCLYHAFLYITYRMLNSRLRFQSRLLLVNERQENLAFNVITSYLTSSFLFSLLHIYISQGQKTSHKYGFNSRYVATQDRQITNEKPTTPSFRSSPFDINSIGPHILCVNKPIRLHLIIERKTPEPLVEQTEYKKDIKALPSFPQTRTKAVE